MSQCILLEEAYMKGLKQITGEAFFPIIAGTVKMRQSIPTGKAKWNFPAGKELIVFRGPAKLSVQLGIYPTRFL